MNIHRPIAQPVQSEITPEGEVMIPEAIRRACGLVPGRSVVVGLNAEGEIVILTRTQAKRVGENAKDRRARILAAIDAVGDRFSTGQSTEEIMRELRGDRGE